MMPIVLALAGGRGSGKTVVSTRLATQLGVKRTSFGEYVRSEARRLGLDQSTGTLQDLGQRLVTAGPRKFGEDVLRTAGWNGTEGLVIDGIRHLEILDALRSLVGRSLLRLILLEVDLQTRKARLERRGDDVSDFEQLDMAPTEVQIFSALPGAADLVVDGTLPVEQVADRIIREFI